VLVVTAPSRPPPLRDQFMPPCHSPHLPPMLGHGACAHEVGTKGRERAVRIGKREGSIEFILTS
jgi:hypothetical protein